MYQEYQPLTYIQGSQIESHYGGGKTNVHKCYAKPNTKLKEEMSPKFVHTLARMIEKLS